MQNHMRDVWDNKVHLHAIVQLCSIYLTLSHPTYYMRHGCSALIQLIADIDINQSTTCESIIIPVQCEASQCYKLFSDVCYPFVLFYLIQFILSALYFF